MLLTARLFVSFYFSSAGGWVKIQLKLTTLPHMYVSCIKLDLVVEHNVAADSGGANCLNVFVFCCVVFSVPGRRARYPLAPLTLFSVNIDDNLHGRISARIIDKKCSRIWSRLTAILC